MNFEDTLIIFKYVLLRVEKREKNQASIKGSVQNTSSSSTSSGEARSFHDIGCSFRETITRAFEGGAITGKSATRSGLAKSFRRRKDCSPRAEQGETFRPNSLERHEKASFPPVGTGRVQRPRSTRRRITSHHPPPNVAVRMEEIGKQQKNNGARRRVCIHLYIQILITHSFVTKEFSIEEFRNLGDI